MYAVVSGLLGLVDWQVKGAFWVRLPLLLGAVGGGAAAYWGVCWLCRVEEVNQGWRLLAERLARRRSGQTDVQ